ncbi:DJ-1/PfpI family protein [Bacillus sp. FJAT-29814]|uniref:DJ-1/PfpI family protein n=1 Tax=Bacillus sp. FJAT-29814 TaxID=1729688 RepID=UPI0009EC6F7E|nr:DJ-1/PfpI family protein [Bacillus sp. FJAT-29814]
MKIQIVLFEGFGELVALAPYEVLKRGIEAGAPFEIELVASQSQKEVVSSLGVQVTVHDFLRLDNRPDLLIIPGGGWNHKVQTGRQAVYHSMRRFFIFFKLLLAFHFLIPIHVI